MSAIYQEYLNHFLTSPEDHQWKLKLGVAEAEVPLIAKDMLDWEKNPVLGLTQTDIHDILHGTHSSEPELMRC